MQDYLYSRCARSLVNGNQRIERVSPIEELQFILCALADFGARRFGGDMVQQILSKIALLARSFDQTEAQGDKLLGSEPLFLLQRYIQRERRVTVQIGEQIEYRVLPVTRH